VLYVSFPLKEYFKGNWIASRLCSGVLGLRCRCRGRDWLVLITVSV